MEVLLPVSQHCSHETLLWIAQCRKVDAMPWVGHPSGGCQRNDTHVGVWDFSSARHDGQELLDNHGVCQVVDSKVLFETVFATAGRDDHDACVTPMV